VGQVRSGLRLRLWHDEHHVSYLVELDAERPRPELPDGLRLVEGDASDLHQLPAIPATGVIMGRGWLERGARLFLVLDAEDRAAFAGWVFHDEVSVSVAPRGWLALPDGVGCLDECYIAPHLRGRGIAPAAFSLIADRLAAEGDSMLLAVTGAEGRAPWRALEKAGLGPVADLYTRRHLNVAGMRVESAPGAGLAFEALWADDLTT